MAQRDLDLFLNAIQNFDQTTRANRAQRLQEDYAQMSRDRMMADQGMVRPPDPNSPDFQTKTAKFIQAMQQGLGGKVKSGLMDQYVPDTDPMSNFNLNKAGSLLDLQLKQKQLEGNQSGLTPYQQSQLDLQQQRLDLQKDKFAFDKGKKDQKKKDAQKRVSGNLEAMASLYKLLGKKGGIIDTKKSGLANLGAAISSSRIGQATGRTFGTEEQSIRNRIKSIQPLLMNDIRQASEMGARGLDSEKELEFYMQATGDTNRDLQSNLAAIVILNRAYGLGAKGLNVDEKYINELEKEYMDYSSSTSLGDWTEEEEKLLQDLERKEREGTLK